MTWEKGEILFEEDGVVTDFLETELFETRVFFVDRWKRRRFGGEERGSGGEGRGTGGGSGSGGSGSWSGRGWD